jgi:lysozyme
MKLPMTKMMEKIKHVSKNCLMIIEEFECKGNFRNYLKSYLCPSGHWTIGMGTTRYPDGSPVMPGDVITEQRVFECVTHDVAATEQAVCAAVKPFINQNQLDALVVFAYNVGIPRFEGSTLLKLVNANPNNPAIAKAFESWKFGGDGSHNGKDDDGDGLIDEPGEKQRLEGLLRRRRCEAWLYFNNELKFQFT